ncbi:hypothetical protein B0H11DRAFT_2135401 [Mycena galericulata]|nr:hypothetical protein B0H11DRAFT_2135401 [Mycena galericulata]
MIVVHYLFLFFFLPSSSTPTIRVQTRFCSTALLSLSAAGHTFLPSIPSTPAKRCSPKRSTKWTSPCAELRSASNASPAMVSLAVLQIRALSASRAPVPVRNTKYNNN